VAKKNPYEMASWSYRVSQAHHKLQGNPAVGQPVFHGMIESPENFEKRGGSFASGGHFGQVFFADGCNLSYSRVAMMSNVVNRIINHALDHHKWIVYNIKKQTIGRFIIGLPRLSYFSRSLAGSYMDMFR
jgi:hypothetical protein